MRNLALGLLAGLALAAVVMAQGSNNPQPTCRMCPSTYISNDEILAYVKKAQAEKLTDQQRMLTQQVTNNRMTNDE